VSGKKLTRTVLGGLVVAAGVLLLAAGPAMANDSSDGAKGAGGSGSGFTDGVGPGPANDVTPGGVPVFGVLDSAKSAPAKVVPDGSGSGSGSGSGGSGSGGSGY
jgi:hypothetical protein